MTEDLLRYTSHVRKGHSRWVTELLLAGVRCDSPSTYRYTLLMTAAKSNYPLIVEILLNLGADVDATASCRRTPTICAAYSGSSDALKVLILAGANLDIVAQGTYSVLSTDILEDRPQIALPLLGQGVQVNRHYGQVKATVSHLAVRQNQHEIVEALLAKDADVEACDVVGETALQWAVEGGRLETVEFLLRHGGQIYRRNGYIGGTVLYCAVRRGFASMTQAPLAHGSNALLLDLDRVQTGERGHSHGDSDNENFETCKVLVETALAGMKFRYLEDSQSPLHGFPIVAQEHKSRPIARLQFLQD